MDNNGLSFYEVTLPDGFHPDTSRDFSGLVLARLDPDQAALVKSCCTWDTRAFTEMTFSPGTEPDDSEVDFDDQFDALITLLRQAQQHSPSIAMRRLHRVTLPCAERNMLAVVEVMDSASRAPLSVEDRLTTTLRKFATCPTLVTGRPNPFREKLKNKAVGDIALYWQEWILSNDLFDVDLDIVAVHTLPIDSASFVPPRHGHLAQA